MKRTSSMYLYAIRITALACLIATVAYLLVSTTSAVILRRHYSSVSFDEGKRAEYIKSLQTYVTDNNLTPSDQDALSSWLEEHSNLYITVYHEGPPLFEAGARYYKDISRRDSVNPIPSGCAVIDFADSSYLVDFEDCSYVRYKQLWQTVSAVIAFFPLLYVALFFIHLLIGHIRTLSKAAERINNGNMDTPVVLKPPATAEMLSLTKSMDNMRLSLRSRIQENQERIRSNRELLTVMSHDIRTPLTTLIGYAEILDQDPDLDPEERKQYQSIIYRRALRLKELTDEMFYYFLVYGSSEIKVERSYYNALVLIPQVISDRVMALQGSNVDVQVSNCEYPFTLYTDISLLNRVFENIFSNIRKYGDLSFPVSISVARKEDDYLHIEITNRIREAGAETESTHIGIKTSQKLMALLDGAFLDRNDGEYYTSEVLIPIYTSTISDTL